MRKAERTEAADQPQFEALEQRLMLSSTLFSDTFASTVIDAANWTGGSGATVDDVGMDEPSAAYSLHLDGDPGGGDSIESRVIDLSAYGDATLSYYYQRTGGGNSTEPADDLIAEYWTGAAWAELERQLGDGDDMVSYTQSSITLTAEEMHSGFRFRFRNIATTGPFDDWFIDDVAVTTGNPPRIISHTPDPITGAVDSLTVTFDQPIDAATFTAEDVQALLPSPIALLGKYDTPDFAMGIAISGDCAYVADDSSLQIINISDVSAPVLVGSCDTLDAVLDVTVSGTLAYVAGYTSGLQIVDISNPSSPVLVGSYDTPGEAWDIAVSGTLAYVADYNSGLQILDVSNPSAPTFVGSYDIGNSILGVHVSGNLAYVPAIDGLRIIDVSDPSTPTFVGGCLTPGYALDVTVSGELAYVADFESGLQIIDVSAPSSPMIIGSYDTPYRAWGVTVSGTLAYVADDTSLQVINVFNPVEPVLVGGYGATITGDERVEDVAAVNGVAYMPDHEAGLQIISVPTLQDISGVTQLDATTYRIDLPGVLPDGEYNVYIGPNIADLSGNAMDQNLDGIGGEPTDIYSFSFTTDTISPGVPVDLMFVEDTGGPGDGVTTDTSILFTWSEPSDENGIVGYEYRLDGGDWMWTDETGLYIPAVDEGPHCFEVRAKDNAGNLSDISTISLAVDLTAPEAPTALHLNGAVLHWDEAVDVVGIWKYEYRLDGGDWAETLTLETPTGLADGGSALFEVRAIDKAGNVGPIASATLTADYGPHVVSHTPSGTVGATNSLTVTFSEPIDPATFTAEDVQVLLSSPPTFVGSYDTPGSAYGVTVSDTLAYVADSTSGLQIIDISDPSAPVLVGSYDTPGRARGVTVSGTLAYIADDFSGLQIIDISNPSAPVLVGSYDTPGYAEDVTVFGALAYVADYYDGLQIIDISDPSAPVLMGSYDTPDRANGVTVSGTLAYVADSYNGLQIIDVSDPSSPMLVGSYDTPGYAYGVTVSDTLAYVADSTSGLQVIDIADPLMPVLVGSYDTPGNAFGVTVSGTLAYVADSSSGLQIIDVSDPSALMLVDSYDTPRYARGVTVSGTLAYVADDNSGLQIIRVATPQEVSGVTQLNATTFQIDLPGVLSDGNYRVHVAPDITDLSGNTMDQNSDGVAGAAADDVYTFSFTTDATAPEAPGDLAFAEDTGVADDNLTADTLLQFTWSEPSDVAGIAGYEYRLDGGAWMWTTETTVEIPVAEGERIFDVRAEDVLGRPGAAASLTVTVDATVPAAPTGLHLNGAVLHWDEVTDASGIWKYEYRLDGGDWVETTAIEAPTGLADAQIALCEVRALDTAGNVGLVASATLTADYGPRVVSHTPDGTVGAVDSVTVTFSEPIDAATFTAEDVQVLLPFPAFAGSYDTPDGVVIGSSVVGSLAYVGDIESGLQIIDVSDPSSPVLLGSYNPPGGGVLGTTVVGTLAYLGSGPDGLQIIDISDPTSPLLVGSYDTLGSALFTAVVGSLTYVTYQVNDFETGFHIIDVSEPSSPVLVGSYNHSGQTFGINVVGNLAYVANNLNGLRIIDVSDPSSPVLVGSYDTPGEAIGITVAASLAYVGDMESGLQIIDVSDPSSPILVGSYDTPGEAFWITVVESLAYVGDGESGLHIIDVSDPSSPLLVSSYDTPGSTHGVTISGTVAYVADGPGGLQIIEVFEPQAVSGVTQLDATTFRIDMSGILSSGFYQVNILPGVSDLAGNTMDQDLDGVGGVASDDVYTFSFTTVAPPTAPAVLAQTESGGDSVAEGTWQQDDSPYFQWNVPNPDSPIVGYEYRLDDGGWTYTEDAFVQYSAGALSNGQRTFEVKAKDSLDQWGQPSSFNIWVDDGEDSIAGLAASQDDFAVSSGGWAGNSTINLTWNASSVSPIVGYSVDWDAAPDTSTAETGTKSYSATVPGIGQHIFNVRAIDQAGNAGPVASFTVNVGARQYTVNSLADGGSINDGQFTLREALESANANIAPGDAHANSVFIGYDDRDRIVFDAALLVSGPEIITLGGTQLDITDSLVLEGPGSDQLAIDANDQSRVLYISGSETEVELAGLTLKGGATTGNGGGICNYGTLTLTDSTVSGNSATGTYSDGGGIYNYYGSVILTNTTVSGNSASDDGGGIYNSFGTLTLTNSTVSGNSASYDGGGVYNSYGTLTLTNSTVSGNLATGTYSDGGGIYNSNGTLTLNNTVVAGNSAGRDTPDIYGDVDSTSSHNFIGDADGLEGITDGVDGNIVGGGDPLLTAISSPEGWVQYYLLQANSPLIDAGDNALALDDSGAPLLSDQRGQDRIVGAAVDIGAIEMQLTPELSVSPTPDVVVQEGSSSEVSVSLTGIPATPLVVSVTKEPGGSDLLTADVSSLTFDATNWDIPQAVTVSSPWDANSDDETACFTLSSPGLTTVRVFATNRERQRYTVDSLADTTLADGKLTLREAIEAANTNAAVGDAPAGDDSGIDLITFDQVALSTEAGVAVGDPLTITLNESAGGGFWITDSLILEGPGANVLTIDADGWGCVLGIEGWATEVSISGLTITGGNSFTAGGGISNEGILTLADSIVSGNTGGDYGGGIYNGGTLTVIDTNISGNSVVPGEYSYMWGQDMLYGGGIFNEYCGTVTLIRSSVTNNSADCGGGIFNTRYDESDHGTVTLLDSTVAGNSAESGGGICSRSYSGGSAVTLTNSTVVGNSGERCGGIYNVGGTLALNNSIVALNRASDCVEVSGAISGCNNLIGLDPGFVRNPSAGADGVWGTEDDDLGDLHLVDTSLAINRGDNALAIGTEGNPLTVDLDGNPRTVDGSVDIGAYEYQGSPSPLMETPSTVVTIIADNADTTDGQISLREAVFYASFVGEDITFDTALSGGMIALGGSELSICGSVVIDATSIGGMTIDAAGQSDVFCILNPEAEVGLSNLSITGGTDFQISNWGTLMLTNAAVLGNSSESGGGIYNEGTLTLMNTTVSGNSSEYSGGGIYNDYYGTLTLTDSTVSGNSASYYGGGIYNRSTVTMINSTVSGNSADGEGGGIYNYGGVVSLTNTVVGFNDAPTDADVFGTYDAYNSMVGGDPGFVRNPSAGADGEWGTEDDDLGDLHLLVTSAAVDAGDNALAVDGEGVPLTTDLDGKGRIYGTTVDIGAYEYALGGDADYDGDVDLADFIALKNNFQAGTTWEQGNFNGDDIVDLDDFILLKNNFTGGAATSQAAAEPVEMDSVTTSAASIQSTDVLSGVPQELDTVQATSPENDGMARIVAPRGFAEPLEAVWLNEAAVVDLPNHPGYGGNHGPSRHAEHVDALIRETVLHVKTPANRIGRLDDLTDDGLLDVLSLPALGLAV